MGKTMGAERLKPALVIGAVVATLVSLLTAAILFQSRIAGGHALERLAAEREEYASEFYQASSSAREAGVIRLSDLALASHELFDAELAGAWTLRQRVRACTRYVSREELMLRKFEALLITSTMGDETDNLLLAQLSVAKAKVRLAEIKSEKFQQTE